VNNPHILAIDAMNLLHRARSGFKLGDHYVAFNFLRGLRALIEKFAPTRVYLCLEGYPHIRHQVFPAYKANRIVDPSDIKKVTELNDFFKQANQTVDLVKNYFPISTIMHQNLEADDVIYNLIVNSWSSIPWTVVSTDTDFIQLLDFQHVNVYNPVKKQFLEPIKDYVIWKALRGDSSDNIPGIPDISDKRATEFVADPTTLANFFETDPEAFVLFKRNVQLIKFIRWTDEEALLLQSSKPERNWDAVKECFNKWDFKSLSNNDKFFSTFDPLFGAIT